MTRRETDPLNQLADELALHAWLASAELKNPSLHRGKTRGEVDALARLRDELRLQAHLGKLDARDELERAEAKWRQFKVLAMEAAEDAGAALETLLGEIRAGYRSLSARE